MAKEQYKYKYYIDENDSRVVLNGETFPLEYIKECYISGSTTTIGGVGNHE